MWNQISYSRQIETSFEFYSENELSIRYLKPFGITAYVSVPRQLGNNLQSKAKKDIFIGYSVRTKVFQSGFLRRKAFSIKWNFDQLMNCLIN